jgi:hypothetical protein
MRIRTWSWLATGVQFLLLAGCTPVLMTPTVAARPGLGKTPSDFAADNTACAAQANQQIAAARTEASNQNLATLLVADPDTASATMQHNNGVLQLQLDIAYSACMYAKGEMVPGQAVEDQPIANPRRTVSRPKPKPTTSTTTAFEEPPPSATSASSTSFTEPPAARQ